MAGVKKKRKTVSEGANPFGVKPGQIWESLDKRYPQIFQIHQVREDYGYVNAYVPSLKKYRRIKLTRFVPRSNGYRIVKDV